MKTKHLLITVIAILLISLGSGCTTHISMAAPKSEFSETYIESHSGKVSVEIPEVFELAHIAWAIARVDFEDEQQTLTNSEYYQKVLDHFLPYQDHELIDILKKGEIFSTYYGFRTNSAAYTFADENIKHEGIYPTAWSPDIFTQNLELVEDFARESGFRQFFKENRAYYAQQIESYEQKVPIKDMWNWLEARFPARYDSYKVLFSPLIKASHNTQRFHNNFFSETVMYVAGPDLYLERDLDPQVELGHLARIVFTEIDHNYVNPISDQFKEEIDEAFTEIDFWNSGLEYAGYGTSLMTFNEYMTWGVFIVYLDETMPQNVAREVAQSTVELMEERRGFPQFGAFCEELKRIYQNNPDQYPAFEDIYPPILDWAAAYQNK